VLKDEHRAMKEYWGSGSMDSRIFDLGTRWTWVVSFEHLPLYPQGKSPWYPLDKTQSGPQSLSGRGGERKNSQPLLGTRTLDHPARSPALQKNNLYIIQSSRDVVWMKVLIGYMWIDARAHPKKGFTYLVDFLNPMSQMKPQWPWGLRRECLWPLEQ